jgi:carboxylesterase type B
LPLFFHPVIEPEKHKDEVFLPDRPIDLIRNGKFHNVPLIIGVTSKEGKLILPGRRFFYFTSMFRSKLALYEFSQM